jgi:hypothetical protein
VRGCVGRPATTEREAREAVKQERLAVSGELEDLQLGFEHYNSNLAGLPEVPGQQRARTSGSTRRGLGGASQTCSAVTGQRTT